MVGGGTGKEEMLVMGCCRGDFVGAAALLDAGADPNCSDTSTGWSFALCYTYFIIFYVYKTNYLYFRTPLHFASKNNHIALVSLLLSRGADPSARNILGQTAREMTSSLEIATLLRISDSPPTSPDTHSLADRSYEAPQDRRLSQSEGK